MFDTVCLMARGQIAYFGKVPPLALEHAKLHTHSGTCFQLAAALPYFSSLGYECPRYSNPAEFFMQQLSISPTAVRFCFSFLVCCALVLTLDIIR